MKKILMTFFFIFTVTLFFAHVPTAVNINLDSSNNIVVVEVKHDISTTKASDPAKHFIIQIAIKINDKDIEVKTFKIQDVNDRQMTAFIVPILKKGDKITVQAKCNINGILTGELTVK